MGCANTCMLCFWPWQRVPWNRNRGSHNRRYTSVWLDWISRSQSQVCVRPEEGYCSICWQGCQNVINGMGATPTNGPFETDMSAGDDGVDGCANTIVSVNCKERPDRISCQSPSIKFRFVFSAFKSSVKQVVSQPLVGLFVRCLAHFWSKPSSKG